MKVRDRKKYKVTTNSQHQQPLYENMLARNFATDRPNQASVQDISQFQLPLEVRRLLLTYKQQGYRPSFIYLWDSTDFSP